MAPSLTLGPRALGLKRLTDGVESLKGIDQLLQYMDGDLSPHGQLAWWNHDNGAPKPVELVSPVHRSITNT